MATIAILNDIVERDSISAFFFFLVSSYKLKFTCSSVAVDFKVNMSQFKIYSLS